jgi:hypothetical protein
MNTCVGCEEQLRRNQPRLTCSFYTKGFQISDSTPMIHPVSSAVLDDRPAFPDPAQGPGRSTCSISSARYARFERLSAGSFRVTPATPHLLCRIAHVSLIQPTIGLLRLTSSTSPSFEWTENSKATLVYLSSDRCLSPCPRVRRTCRLCGSSSSARSDPVVSTQARKTSRQLAGAPFADCVVQ